MERQTKISRDEAEKYTRFVMEHVFKGQSAAATLIALGTYVLLDFVKNPNRFDLFAFGVAAVLSGYVYNYLRALKKARIRREA